MQNNILILTATDRLASYRQETDNKIGVTQVFSLNQWLVECQQQLPTAELPRLLTKAQTHVLWQQIVSEQLNPHYKQIPGYAKLAEQAARLAKQWEIDPESLASSDNEAVQLFTKWFERFETYCQRNNFCDQAGLAHYLLPYFQRQSISLPNIIKFTGFDELPPYLMRLIKTLEVHCTIEIDRLPNNANTKTSAYRLACQSKQNELFMAARWALAHHQSHPHATIGCIVPDLSHCRPQVESAFKEVFNAAYRLPDNHTPTFPVNIAGGQPLSHYPLIKAALTALKLSTTPTAHFNDISETLRSPFIADNYSNTTKLAQIDVELREWNETMIPLSAPILPPWFKPLAQQRPSKEQQLPSHWAQVLKSTLTAIGWPGERSLNSEEYQLVQRWDKLLGELAGLDQFIGPCAYSTAIERLIDLAHNTLFQAKTDKQPVQVLGVLEAAGIHFDALWVTGMHDANWPPPAQPNPFLPITLQRSLGMPHAGAARELDFCHKLTQRLRASSATLIFSYPEQIDNQPVNVSPLIAALPTIDTTSLTLAAHPSPAYHKTSVSHIRDYEHDNKAPTVTPDEPITGGSAVFKRQAACPFSAFATLRLGAKRLPAPRLGLSPIERGQLIHCALDTLWQMIKTQHTLHNDTPEQRQTVIEKSVQTALKQLNHKRHTRLSTQFTKLETQRLTALLQAWLAYEAKRPPFTVIAREKSYHTTLGKLPLRLCIDRIDQLADGSYIIIDYKTGISNILQWFGDRPDAPQLPLYCITFDAFPVSGAAFAEIHAKKIKFKGITAQADQLPHVKAVHAFQGADIAGDWPTLKANWQKTLQALGDAFMNGVATVDPKNQAATCRYCDLQTLCRRQFNP